MATQDASAVESAPSLRVAIITAIYGNYERTCKRVTPQISQHIVDSICFSDNQDIASNGWTVDSTPYHKLYPNPMDTVEHKNSLQNNANTFNVAKYYKQSFHCIPRLKGYDVVIWVDGTIEITNPKAIETVLAYLRIPEKNIVVFEHEHRNGSLEAEMIASDFGRYTSTFWHNQSQPYQDVPAQYKAYIDDGYTESMWKEQGSRHSDNTGVWITCFVVFDMRHPRTVPFLDMWYLQTLKYTTQDQVGFPFALQKIGIVPYSLPDEAVKGFPHSWTDLYVKHQHNC